MSSSTLVFIGLLVCFASVRVGNALQCYSYQCANYSAIVPNKPCPQPKAVTCGLSMVGTPADRCSTTRIKTKMEMGGQVVVMHQETRNCTSSLQCNPELVCKYANQSSGGKIEKCELGCCQGDLCNTGGPIPTPGPKPTGPSGSDLSCYSCSSIPFAIPGMPLAKADCKNPVKQTCGPDMVPGMQQDRCVRIKAKISGIEAEIRNCSGFSFCNPGVICKAMNQTGIVSSCDVSCCYGNLCNTDAAPTTLSPIDASTVPTSNNASTVPVSNNASTVPVSNNASTVPVSTNASTVPASNNASTVPASTSGPDAVTVPGSAVVLTGTLTCLLVTFARGLVMIAEMM